MSPSEADAAPAADAPRKSGGKRAVQIYLAGYAVLLVAYVGFLLTGGETLSPATAQERVEALLGVERPTHTIRLWRDLGFDGPAGVRYNLGAGEELTPEELEALAWALRRDATRPEDDRLFPELAVYRPGIYPNLPWAYLLNTYNIVGLALLLTVLLREPLSTFLGEQARKTAGELAAAKAARREAEALKERYDAMLAELEEEKKRLAQTEEEEFAHERDRILTSARHEAEGLLRQHREGMEAEILARIDDLRAEIGRQALEEARAILAREVSEEDHRRAIETFVAELEKTRA